MLCGFGKPGQFWWKIQLCWATVYFLGIRISLCAPLQSNNRIWDHKIAFNYLGFVQKYIPRNTFFKTSSLVCDFAAFLSFWTHTRCTLHGLVVVILLMLDVFVCLLYLSPNLNLKSQSDGPLLSQAYIWVCQLQPHTSSYVCACVRVCVCVCTWSLDQDMSVWARMCWRFPPYLPPRLSSAFWSHNRIT